MPLHNAAVWQRRAMSDILVSVGLTLAFAHKIISMNGGCSGALVLPCVRSPVRSFALHQCVFAPTSKAKLSIKQPVASSAQFTAAK